MKGLDIAHSCRVSRYISWCFISLSLVVHCLIIFEFLTQGLKFDSLNKFLFIQNLFIIFNLASFKLYIRHALYAMLAYKIINKTSTHALPIIMNGSVNRRLRWIITLIPRRCKRCHIMLKGKHLVYRNMIMQRRTIQRR